jgi:hypothetical protein
VKIGWDDIQHISKNKQEIDESFFQESIVKIVATNWEIKLLVVRFSPNSPYGSMIRGPK